jgi:hypothetical protein
MRDVLSRPTRLALVSLAVIGLVMTWTTVASAAIPAAGTAPTSWQGQYYGAISVADPTLCPPGAADPGNTICDHFALTVSSAGNVTVTITWPSANCANNPTNPTPGTPCDTSGNDFDLYVYDSNNMLVASSANPNPPGNSESASFSATAQTYEVRVVPFFVVNSDYAGTATFTPAGGGGGQGGGIDPPISISNASVAEGDSGTSAATFTLSLGWPTSVPVTVNYVTADAWADSTATPLTDYVPSTGTVVFAPGQTRATVNIPVVGDTGREANETFLVNLFLPDPPIAVAKIQDGQGVGTIRNDDWTHWIYGGGKLGLPLGSQGYFSVYANEGKYGRISYRDSSVRFSASNVTSYAYNDATGTATISGNGWNAGHTVTYVLEARDGGPGGVLDSVVLTLSDGSRVSGTLTSGDIKYYS